MTQLKASERLGPIIGQRSLVAKTCTKCHTLKDARHYRKRNDNNCWTSICNPCVIRYPSSVRAREVWAKGEQAVSTEHAAHKGEEWTEAELAVALDASLSAAVVASRLGRTVYGVNHIRSTRGAKAMPNRSPKKRASAEPKPNYTPPVATPPTLPATGNVADEPKVCPRCFLVRPCEHDDGLLA